MIKSFAEIDLFQDPEFQDPEFVKLTQLLADDPELSFALSVLLLARLTSILKRHFAVKRA